MGFTPNLPLLLVVILALLPTQAYAFGAGDIPDFAYLNDKAFRHGDIENILENIVKNVGGAAIGLGGGGLLTLAKSVFQQASGGAKFTKSDIKKVYFGNWLRDYSQAMDIGGLSKLSADTLVLVIRILGFMTFGFATEEFEVTAERLGVYLPVEHIDNPKGYAEKEGDARRYHSKLRPPVNPRELEIDGRNGMKKYMATENQDWDTSTALIRRTFRACINMGRRANGQEGAQLWEAYRLLGTGLHTMEDLLAHSNWCEIALRKMGHEQVFCHVGDRVLVNTPHGPAPPLVTGTFGGADFLHSLIGEAGDKLSQASVTDLSQKMNQASDNNTASSNIAALKGLLSQFSIGGGEDKLDETEQIHQQSKAYQFNPDNVAPPEVQKQLIELLKWRDSVMRQILEKIEMIPGLSDLIDQVTNALNAYVYTILAPYVAPMLSQATGVLDEGSKAVINNEDQYEVFDNPHASDPSHSLLSKDHFGLILNEPAGKIAQLVVEHTTNLIVQAWADDSNADRVIDKILEAFHHPYYATGRSHIQNAMFECMKKWMDDLEDSRGVIEALTKESVRNHKNKRLGSEDQDWSEAGYGGHSHSGSQAQSGYPPQRGEYDARRRPEETGRTYHTEISQTGEAGYGGHSHSDSQAQSGYPPQKSEYDARRRPEETGRTYHTESSQTGYDDGDGYGGRRNDRDDRRGAYGHDEFESGNEVSSGYGQQVGEQTARRSHENPSRFPSSHRAPREEDRYGGRGQQETAAAYQSARYEDRDSYSGRTNDESYSRAAGEDNRGYGGGDAQRHDHHRRGAYGHDEFGSGNEVYGQQAREQTARRSYENASRFSSSHGASREEDRYGGRSQQETAAAYQPARYEDRDSFPRRNNDDSYGRAAEEDNNRGYGGGGAQRYDTGHGYGHDRGSRENDGLDHDYRTVGRRPDVRENELGGNTSYGQQTGLLYGRQAGSNTYGEDRGQQNSGYGEREDTFGLENLRFENNEGEGGHHSHARRHHHQERY